MAYEKPFNSEVHANLLQAGYVHTQHPADFWDDGDAESGPCLNGHAGYDEYESADDRVIIDDEGKFAHYEVRDLEMEAYIAKMYPSDGYAEFDDYAYYDE